MITYFGGPEGAGKTALMTKFCRDHHLLGGEIWAFPGYEHKNERGRVISKLITPDQIMSKIDELTYIVLVIDEIQNFMNHHSWQNPLIDVLAYGALSQRRKREFVVLATGPEFNYLPPDLRGRFHVVVDCRDVHWRNHAIPRGEKVEFIMRDMLGVLSGRPFTSTRIKMFRPSKYFKYYDTFSLVDPKYQHIRVKIKKDTVLVDSSGNILDVSEEKEDNLDLAITSFLKKNNNPEIVPKGLLSNYLRSYLNRSLTQYEMGRIGVLMSFNGYENPKGKAVFKIAPSLSMAAV